jgi:hypothetical protein
LECGEDRRFGCFSSAYPGGAKKRKKTTKAAILAALQSASQE